MKRNGFWQELHLFDRTKLGRVTRRAYWFTMAAHIVLFAVTFVVPFEIGYRLQVEPDSLYMMVFLYGWLLMFALSIAPVVRLSRRRLHDAGMSGWWLLLGLVPVIGWIVVAVLLMRPTDPRLGRFDRFVEKDRQSDSLRNG